VYTIVIHGLMFSSKRHALGLSFNAKYLEVTFSPWVLIPAYHNSGIVAPNHQSVRVPQWSSFEKMLFHGKVDIWIVTITNDDGCCIIFLGLRLKMRKPALHSKKMSTWSEPA
jgi:hypothetical protein